MGIAQQTDLNECVLILEKTLPARFTKVGNMEYAGYYADFYKHEFGFIYMDYVLHFRYFRAIDRDEAIAEEPMLAMLNPNIEEFHKQEEFEIRIAPNFILSGEFKVKLREMGMPLND